VFGALESSKEHVQARYNAGNAYLLANTEMQHVIKMLKIINFAWLECRRWNK